MARTPASADSPSNLSNSVRQSIAVFGDVQGHLHAFVRGLEAVGVDCATATLPSGLTVIQVGDLIHKGPDSEAVVGLAGRLLQANPGRYVQLVGNHEGQYLGGPVFWPDLIGDAAAVEVAEWYVERRCGVATAAVIGDRPTLVTHGGLTPAKWELIGRPQDPADAAALLNEEFWTDPAHSLLPGAMLRGETTPPGVAWPEPVTELYLPWLEHGAPPFAQIHGHASPFGWHNGRWWRGVPRRLRSLMTGDTDARHTMCEVGSVTFVGVDTANGPMDGDRDIVGFVGPGMLAAMAGAATPGADGADENSDAPGAAVAADQQE